MYVKLYGNERKCPLWKSANLDVIGNHAFSCHVWCDMISRHDPIQEKFYQLAQEIFFLPSVNRRVNCSTIVLYRATFSYLYGRPIKQHNWTLPSLLPWRQVFLKMRWRRVLSPCQLLRTENTKSTYTKILKSKFNSFLGLLSRLGGLQSKTQFFKPSKQSLLRLITEACKSGKGCR